MTFMDILLHTLTSILCLNHSAGAYTQWWSTDGSDVIVCAHVLHDLVHSFST